MKVISKNRVIYSFSRDLEPVDYVDLNEPIVLETEDALGGQVKSEDFSLDKLDWSKVNPATGPIYINGVKKGDTLVVNILDIEIADKGVILVVPGYGILGEKKFSSRVKIVEINGDFIDFNGIKLKTRPSIGTIGVAPPGDPIPTAVPYTHGGNLDCKELVKGTKLYLPVFVDGALFAAGDLHAVQADGELCVASIEVAGRVLLKFDVIRGKQPRWPIIETDDKFLLLTSDESIEKAIKIASEEAINAIVNAKRWTFEEAYMFSSLSIDIAINQVVDPKKGARAEIPKDIITINDLLS